jgi:hypothetical protein
MEVTIMTYEDSEVEIFITKELKHYDLYTNAYVYKVIRNFYNDNIRQEGTFNTEFEAQSKANEYLESVTFEA